MRIREATAADLPFLEQILLAAYNWAGQRLTLDGMRSDEMAQRYLDGFPRAGDLGVVATIDDRPVGAVWGRVLPADRCGHGFVAADVPELTVGVLPEARGRGIAAALVAAIAELAERRGLPGLSLSVEDGNTARRLYERAGFEVVGRVGDSDTMLLRLARYDIRSFRWADFDGVTAVWAAAGSDPVARAELAAKLTRDPQLFLVAEARGAVAGVVMGTFDGRRGWIFRLAVRPDHRRRGLARRLVQELEHRFRELGCPRVNLLVLPDNAAGLAFWQALGYLPCPDVLCTKPLTP